MYLKLFQAFNHFLVEEEVEVEVIEEVVVDAVVEEVAWEEVVEEEVVVAIEDVAVEEDEVEEEAAEVVERLLSSSLIDTKAYSLQEEKKMRWSP